MRRIVIAFLISLVAGPAFSLDDSELSLLGGYFYYQDLCPLVAAEANSLDPRDVFSILQSKYMKDNESSDRVKKQIFGTMMALGKISGLYTKDKGTEKAVKFCQENRERTLKVASYALEWANKNR
ncbi:hypothetical protein [Mesorhizobium sp. M0129]|uniref:hypothetical protein n=1 Tax=Mesorhizobium sp. M0129 TaxID=2956886 RepID=UPI0033382563